MPLFGVSQKSTMAVTKIYKVAHIMNRILALCSVLLGLHRTSVLRHDEVGQEVLLNLLLRNYLHYNLYDQVRTL